MAQKVDHSALWMYVPNAGGKGVPTYFKPTERDGATVGKLPQQDKQWAAGAGSTEMLITPHGGGGDDEVEVEFRLNYDPLEYDEWGYEDGGGTGFSDALELSAHYLNDSGEQVAVKVTIPSGRALEVSIPGWSGTVTAGFMPQAQDEEFDLFFYEDLAAYLSLHIWITAEGTQSMDGLTMRIVVPRGLVTIDDLPSSEFVVEVPIVAIPYE